MKSLGLGARPIGFLLSGAVALASLGVASPVQADPKPALPAFKIDGKETTDALKSSDSARIESALVNIRTVGRDGGGRLYVLAIAARLKAGLPRELVKKALDTLADLEDPSSTEVGEMYLLHRDPDVRLAAVRCLGTAKTLAAGKALRRALGDLDPKVHALAATLLGATKAADAVADLMTALDKGVNEAASSIGEVCDPKGCDALLDRMKSKPFDVISSGLMQELARKDVGDEQKKKVIKAVRELASMKARDFLVDVKTAWPANGSKAVLATLDQAIKDLEGASK